MMLIYIAALNFMFIPLDVCFMYLSRSQHDGTAIFVISFLSICHFLMTIFVYFSLYKGRWESGNDAKTGNPSIWLVFGYICNLIFIPCILSSDFNQFAFILALSHFVFSIIQFIVLFFLYRYKCISTTNNYVEIV